MSFKPNTESERVLFKAGKKLLPVSKNTKRFILLKSKNLSKH